jgi:hypothetical protein
MSHPVECYAGSTYPERPRALFWQGTRYRVSEVITRRREPEGVGFLGHCTPDEIVFDLFYLIKSDQWLITPKLSQSDEK